MWIDVDLAGRCSVYCRDIAGYAAVATSSLQRKFGYRKAWRKRVRLSAKLISARVFAHAGKI
jgi:hypothetical protein